MNQVLVSLSKEIEKELGIIYNEANLYQLEHRIEDFCHQVGLESMEVLLEKLQSHSLARADRILFFDMATNNETSFFRDRGIFNAFREAILPKLVENGKHVARLWSAASSSGQEIYSVAMEVDRFNNDEQKLQLEYTVTDISERILERAKSGIYSQIEMNRGLTPEETEKYFDKLEDNNFKVKSYLQQGMNFRSQNLLDNFTSLGPFDVIFCRNVLIYQSVENKTRVLGDMHRILNPGGFLILGAAESLFGISEGFNQENYNNSVLYQKK